MDCDCHVGREKQAAVRQSPRSFDGALDLGRVMHRESLRLHAERGCRALECRQHEQVSRGIVRVVNERGAGNAWRGLLEDFQHLADHRELEHREPGDVAARPREARNKALPGRIGDARQDDRNGTGLLAQNRHRAATPDQDRVRLQLDELRRLRSQPVHVVAPEAFLDAEVRAFGPAQLAQLLSECRDARQDVRIVVEPSHQHAHAPRPLALLRSRRKRPRRRAADQRYELAPLHSITSSASESKLSEIVTPSAFAVFKLITNWNLTVSITGKSAGLTPLSTRPVYTPTRRYASEASTP